MAELKTKPSSQDATEFLNGVESVRDLAIVRQVPDAAGEYEPALTLEGDALLARPGPDGEAHNPAARRAAS
jgi:hypothetical protein